MDIQLDHVAINVSDMDRSEAFYGRVLGLKDAFPGEWGGAPRILMAPGSRTGVAIFPAESGPADRPPRPAGVVDHFAFRTSRAAWEAFRGRLEELGIEHDEQRFGICYSVFFRDPDGNKVEVTTYEINS